MGATGRTDDQQPEERSAPDTRRIRVLQSVKPPAPTTNPYIVQLVAALDRYVDVGYFSWRRAILGRYDVLHVHWPEVMVRRDGLAARLAAQARFAALMLRLALTRTPLVRTVHNVRAHETGSRLENLLLSWCERRSSFWILLSPDTPLPRPRPSRVIPHGHYRDWYPATSQQQVPGRLLHFGLIRPYKGVDALIAAFEQLDDARAGLRIVGRPTTAALRAEIEAACARDPRIEALLDYVDDATLAAELAACRLAVLPYRAMHNSGALLLALSLDRPALVPDGPTTRAIADEVGPGWVFTFTGELTAADLAGALTAGQAAPGGRRPRLEGREWPVVAAAHAEVYREVTGR